MKQRKPARSRRAEAAVAEASTLAQATPEEKKSFPIVGIGASAGGLEACKELLKGLPVDTGMGFVLVGAIYLAASAAIFKYASAVKTRTGNALREERARLFREGAAAIKMFLTPEEIRAVETLPENELPVSGRKRFLLLYKALDQRASDLGR